MVNGYRLTTSKKGTKFLRIFTDVTESLVEHRYTVGTVVTTAKLFFLYLFWLLRQREAADGGFADASEVEGAVVFDDVGDLGVAVGGVVLEVVDDAAQGVQTEDEGIALRAGLEEFWQAHDHFSDERIGEHSIN